jgi:hypothetical protein
MDMLRHFLMCRLNKCDTVSEAQVKVLLGALAALNPTACLIPTSNSCVDLHQILNTGEPRHQSALTHTRILMMIKGAAWSFLPSFNRMYKSVRS